MSPSPCRLLVSVLGAALMVAGCQQAGLPGQAPAGRSANAVRSDMLVTTEWLADHLSRPDLVLVQIGPPVKPGQAAPGRAGYDAGHIPGAHYVAWSEIAVTRDGVPNQLASLDELVRLARRLGVTENSRVVLYDNEAGLAAARAYVTFDYLGLGGRAALLDGHWAKWQAESRPVSFSSPAVQPSLFVPRLRPEVLIAQPAVRDLVWQKANQPGAPVALIDARPGPQFSGQEPGEGISRPGHIPGAVNVFWMRNLVSEDDPRLRPVRELRALYEAAGAGNNRLVIAYCRTGGQASHLYFTARYLGYDARLYDGSYWEWSKARDTEVVGPPAATAQPATTRPVRP